MLIKLPVAQRKPSNTTRAHPHEVLGIERVGASSRGNSYWKRLRTCPREHALANVARVQRVGDSEALTVGLTYHHALEAYYRTLHTWQLERSVDNDNNNDDDDDDDDDYFFGALPAAERAAWAAIEPMSHADGYEETYAEIERMFAAYCDQYRRKDRWRIVAVEETLEYFNEDIEYSARLDLVVEDCDRGGLWIVEHKSARMITEDLLHGYQMDQQILGQVWLLHEVVDLAQYPPFRGLIVNITTKHKEPRFERVEVYPSQAHLKAFEQSLRDWKQVAKLFETLKWPKALGNCSGPAHYFQRCEFFDLCHGHPAASVDDFARMPDDQLPFGYVRRADNDDKE